MARQTQTLFSNGIICYRFAQSDQATIVSLAVDFDEGETTYTASGTAKKDNHDKPDDEVGRNLAVARALRSLANKLEKEVADRAFPQHYPIRDPYAEHTNIDQTPDTPIEPMLVDGLLHRLAKNLKNIYGEYK